MICGGRSQMAPPCLCGLSSLHNVFFREVVTDAHAHVLAGARGELGDTGAVVLGRQPGLRVQPRVCPCHVRAVPSILGIVLVLAALAVLGIVLAAVIALAVLVVLVVLVLGHGSSPPG